MTTSTVSNQPKLSPIRRWIRRAFVAWALCSTLWLANSVRTQGVNPAELQSDTRVEVAWSGYELQFLPVDGRHQTGLIFICGSGIAPEAYAPLLRPIAQKGYPVIVVKLPYRFAPFESHKQLAVDTVIEIPSRHPEYCHWVVSGHSLGAAIACRAIQARLRTFQAMVLVGTTHPKVDDLSFLTLPVTKIYGSNDGIATPERTLQNKKLLPAHTRWVEIQGGNHSQFGHYGHQLFDGHASISRIEQQAATRQALLQVLEDAATAEQSSAPESTVNSASSTKSSPPSR